jgi:large conductance mechanosensitive channel
MLKGFKEFVLRGNVIDLAVAVVIGAAFTGIVNAIVTSVFNPLIGALFNASSLAKALPVSIPALAGGTPATLYFGAVIAAVIQFLLVAVVVYFALVIPINYLKKVSFRKKQEEPATADDPPPTELELLAEIRDLLAKRPE